MEDTELTIEVLRPDVDWSDDDRVGSLFSSFRQRDLNAASWDAKMAFWTDVIFKWLTRSGSAVFSVEEIEEKLLKNISRKPYCLNDVVKELKTKGRVVEIKSLQEAWELKRSTWGRWTMKMTAIGARRLLSQVWSGESGAKNVPFVQLQILENKSAEALRALTNSKGFQYAGSVYVEVDNDKMNPLCISNLIHQRFCWPMEVHGVNFLKVDSTRKRVGQPTDEEQAVLSLWKLAREMDRQIESVEKEGTELRILAKSQLTSGNRVTAKATVRKLRRNQKVLEQKLHIGENVNELLSKIETSTDQANVLETYQIGLQTLKSSLNNISRDQAQSVLDEVHDCVGQVNELSDLIAAQTLDDSASEAELNEELEKIIKENDDELLKTLDELTIPGADESSTSKVKKKGATMSSVFY